MGYALKRLEMYFQLFQGVLTLSNKVEKCLCIRFVCLAVCEWSNFHKHSSGVLKFMHAVKIWYRMDIIDNIYGTNCSFRDSQVFRYISACRSWIFSSLLQHIYIAINIMKLYTSFSCTKACFIYRITQKISDILWVIMETDGYAF